jgi:hypothetical protein
MVSHSEHGGYKPVEWLTSSSHPNRGGPDQAGAQMQEGDLATARRSENEPRRAVVNTSFMKDLLLNLRGSIKFFIHFYGTFRANAVGEFSL